MQDWLAVLESTRGLLEIEATNFEEVVDAYVDRTIFEAHYKNICGIGRISCQRLK